jgi:hypothetical protein
MIMASFGCYSPTIPGHDHESRVSQPRETSALKLPGIRGLPAATVTAPPGSSANMLTIC